MATTLYANPNQELLETFDAGGGSVQSNLGGGATQTFVWLTPAGSGVEEWVGTDLPWEYNVSAVGADIDHRLFIDRVDSGGAFIETLFDSGASTRGQSGARSGTYSVPSTAVATTDRLQFRIVTTRLASHGNQTVELMQDGTTFSDAPWETVPEEDPPPHELSFVHDTFTDASNTPLQDHTGEMGATWTKHPASGQDLAISNANRLRGSLTTEGATGLYFASGIPPSADYEVEATMVVLGTTINSFPGPCGRVDETAQTLYQGRWSGAAWQIVRWVDGVASVVASKAFAADVGASYVMGLQLAGATVKLFVDDVEELSFTDPSPITEAGRAGVRILHSSGVTSSDTDGQHLANFNAFGPEGPLAVDGATHAHAAETPALIQGQVLSVDNASHAHAAEAPALQAGLSLVPDDTEHAHIADSPNLAQDHVLSVDGAVHGHVAESASLVQGLPALATLIDDFDDNDLDPALWTIGGSDRGTGSAAVAVAEVNQRIEITLPNNATGYKGIFSTDFFDLTDSHLFAELVAVSTRPVDEAQLLVMSDGQNRCNITVDHDSTVRFRYRNNDVDDDTQLTYDPVAHRWFRIAHSATDILFQTAPDGEDWTTRKTVTAPAWINNIYAVLQAGSWGTAEGNPVVAWDNANTVPAANNPPATPSILSAVQL